MEGSQTTATTGREQIKWRKRVPPKKYEFGAGAVLSGILTARVKITLRDQRTNEPKVALRYTVKDMETGEKWFFHGTVQLDEQLEPSDVGHYVLITCRGEDQKAGRNGNAMKLFDVSVSDDTAPGWANDGTPITNADLPDSEFF